MATLPAPGANDIWGGQMNGWLLVAHNADGTLISAVPVPATTVTGPDTFGGTSSVGTSTSYARADHDHGLPAAPVVPGAATTVAGPPAFGAASAVGTGTAYARNDHVHGLPAAPGGGTPATSVTGPDAFGAASVIGTSTNYARQDHDHGLPAAPAVPGPASTVAGPPAFGAASAVGTGTSFARNDHVHGLPAAPAVPGPATTIVGPDAFGAASAVGTSTLYARADHDHGLPAAAGGSPTGAASGDLSGTYPGPSVAKVNGVAVTGTPSSGQVITATGAAAASWQTPSGGAGNVPNGTANAQVPFWNGTAYVPSLTGLLYPSSAKPAGGTNPGHFVFGGLDNGGTLWFDKADGSGYQQMGPAINAVPAPQVLINGTLGSGTALPTTAPGLTAHNINLRAGANVTITGIQDATNDMNTVTIAATGGGGGGSQVLGSNMVNIASAQTLTSTAVQIGTSQLSFTATTTAVVFIISLYVTLPQTSSNITLTIQQISGNQAQVTAGTSGPVQFVGNATPGTNAASGTSTTKLCGNVATGTTFNMNSTRVIYITNMVVGQAYVWQPYASSAGTSAAIGQDLVTVTVKAA